ncbi:hypothetical protein M8J77_011282 [Diaphorina citri]|nr:hypothetical protein M8J77_011282 [Diaphorina citri]
MSALDSIDQKRTILETIPLVDVGQLICQTDGTSMVEEASDMGLLNSPTDLGLKHFPPHTYRLFDRPEREWWTFYYIRLYHGYHPPDLQYCTSAHTTGSDPTRDLPVQQLQHRSLFHHRD